MSHKKRNVVRPLSERRQPKLDRRETIIEVGAKPARGHLGGEVAVRGGDDPGVDATRVRGAPTDWPHDAVALAIGDNHVRAAMHERLARAHQLPAVVHPRATVAPSATIGDASVLFAGAVVNAATVLGEDAIVNTAATIDHDCVMEPHAHAGPGSHVNGGCVLGRGSFLTTGVIVGHHVTIGAWTVVGAGSVVLADLPGGVLAYGAPAKVARALSNEPIASMITDRRPL